MFLVSAIQQCTSDTMICVSPPPEPPPPPPLGHHGAPGQPRVFCDSFSQAVCSTRAGVFMSMLLYWSHSPSSQTASLKSTSQNLNITISAFVPFFRHQTTVREAEVCSLYLCGYVDSKNSRMKDRIHIWGQLNVSATPQSEQTHQDKVCGFNLVLMSKTL